MITKIVRNIHLLSNLALYWEYSFFPKTVKYLKEVIVNFFINYTIMNYVTYSQRLICNSAKNFNRMLQFQIIFSL